MHGDLCGPIALATRRGKKYFLLLVDDMTRFMWIRLLSGKHEVAAAIKQFQAGVEAETGRKLRALCTYRGEEFTSVEFTEYCADRGVRRDLTAPLLTATEWGRQAPQSNSGGRGALHAQGGGHAGALMG